MIFVFRSHGWGSMNTKYQIVTANLLSVEMTTMAQTHTHICHLTLGSLFIVIILHGKDKDETTRCGLKHKFAEQHLDS